jgi:hypothetical protein
MATIVNAMGAFAPTRAVASSSSSTFRKGDALVTKITPAAMRSGRSRGGGVASLRVMAASEEDIADIEARLKPKRAKPKVRCPLYKPKSVYP